MRVNIEVNNVPWEEDVEPRLLLADFLRDTLGLTGTHIGCEDGKCGACTVMVDGRAVKSCLMFAVQANGRRITTVEGLAEGVRLHPAQEAFGAEHGLQCGYCTPGMLMATLALLGRNPDPTDEEIRKALVGNICRCTGYTNIVKAVRRAAISMRKNDTEARAPVEAR